MLHTKHQILNIAHVMPELGSYSILSLNWQAELDPKPNGNKETLPFKFRYDNSFMQTAHAGLPLNSSSG